MDKINPVELGIQATTMAIREELMRYFKGTCIESLTHRGGVTTVGAVVWHDDMRQYEQRKIAQERPQHIVIGPAMVLTVKMSPDRLIFADNTLERSPQFKTIKKNIEVFMRRYLKGVHIEYEGKIPKKLSDDTDLVRIARPRTEDRQTPSEGWEASGPTLSFTDTLFGELEF